MDDERSYPTTMKFNYPFAYGRLYMVVELYLNGFMDMARLKQEWQEIDNVLNGKPVGR